MINMLTFSIWVLFQTSSKKARETNKKTQATRQPHQAIKGFISGRNFHNIRNQLDKKRSTPQNACKKQQPQTGNLNLTKQRASSEGETFTISEENCIIKELWTVKKTLFYILIDCPITI